ncbi:MAG TPA: Abi family protein [Noviherbaspirillum sp.]|nr:Abi family protein [Noviherbaspirillum sp.]
MNAYKHFFKTANDDELIGCYMWNEAVSSALSTVLNLFELTLRNQIHLTLSQIDGGGAAKSTDWYHPHKSIVHLSAESKEKIGRLLYSDPNTQTFKMPAPNPNDVVASLSFGFWTTLIEGTRVSQGSFRIPRIFPVRGTSVPISEWSHNQRIRLKPLARDLKKLKDFRNRIAHLEPLWTLADDYDGNGAVRRPRLPGESIIGLRRFHTFMESSLDWFSPKLKPAYQATYAYHHVNTLLTTDALYAFATRAGTADAMLVRFSSRQFSERNNLSAPLRRRT